MQFFLQILKALSSCMIDKKKMLQVIDLCVNFWPANVPPNDGIHVPKLTSIWSPKSPNLCLPFRNRHVNTNAHVQNVSWQG